MIIDGIVIFLIILSAYSGYKKGFSTILLSLIGFILAIVLAFMFRSTLANFVINDTDVDTFMNQIIHTGLDKAVEYNNNNVEGTPNQFYMNIIKNITTQETVDSLSNNITNFIIQTGAFILLFLTLRMCTYIIEMMLNVVFDLPILSSINSIAGLGVGIVMCIFKIWVVLALVSILMPVFGQFKSLIDATTITKMLYNTNIIVNLLSGGFKF